MRTARYADLSLRVKRMPLLAEAPIQRIMQTARISNEMILLLVELYCVIKLRKQDGFSISNEELRVIEDIEKCASL